MNKFGFLFLILVAGTALITGSVAAQDDLPILDDMEVGQWSQINPGGETMCSRGDEYKFFVRPAESDNLLIHFQGGGACWNADTCSFGNAYSEGGRFFKDAVVDDEGMIYTNGLFDLENPDNPAADYNVVLITYCSADVHAGDAVTSYDLPDSSGDIRVAHRGVANTASALDWIFENFLEPQQVFITGCSAGAYGSIVHAPGIIDQYEDAITVQLGDSGTGGLITSGWEGFQNWNYFANVPDILAELSAEEFSIMTLYVLTAQAYPDSTFAQYNTFVDLTQIFFAALINDIDLADASSLNEIREDWSAAMVNNQVMMEEMVGGNYASFVAGGGEHCILNDAYFYDYHADGVSFVDWVAGLLEGSTEDVSCDAEAGECLVPPEPLSE